MFDNEILALAADALDHYRSLEDRQYIVSPAKPVLYFGDFQSYLRAEDRIVTVGVNPSRREFPAERPFLRFSDANDPALYLAALNRYFDQEPLDWFDGYEKVLRGLKSSYRNGRDRSVAIHTDIGSVLPTDPTWTGLNRINKSIQNDLKKVGIPLWHRLIEYLQPDIILASIGEEWLHEFRFPSLSDWQTICSFPHKKNGTLRRVAFEVRGQQVQLSTGKQALLVYAAYLQTPFGHLSDEGKSEAGAAIIEHWEKRVVAHKKR